MLENKASIYPRRHQTDMVRIQKTSIRLNFYKFSPKCSCSSLKLVVRCQGAGKGLPISPCNLARSSTAADAIFYLDNHGRKTSYKTLPAQDRCLSFSSLDGSHTSVFLSRSMDLSTLRHLKHTQKFWSLWSPHALGKPFKCNGTDCRLGTSLYSLGSC